MSDGQAGETMTVEPAVEEKKTKAAKGGKSAPKKKAQAKSGQSASHPKYSKMIAEAITSLKERNGSSRQAILKYIMNKYDMGKDEKTVNSHIKMSLRASIKNGTLKRSKGVGASGSFKIGDKLKTERKPAKKATPTKEAKPKTLSKVKKPKAAKAKKPAKAQKSTPKKSTKKAKSPKKAIGKATKTSKAKATKKTKSPKASKGKKSVKNSKPEQKVETSDSGATSETPTAESS